MTLQCNQRCFLSRFTTQVYLNAHAYYLFQECYGAQQLCAPTRQTAPKPRPGADYLAPAPHPHQRRL